VEISNMMAEPSHFLAVSWLKLGLLVGGIGLAACVVASVVMIVFVAARRRSGSDAGRAQAAESIEQLSLGLDKMQRRLANIETILMREDAGADPERQARS
jgi:hypothetical protein